jgi:hypothetical protein
MIRTLVSSHKGCALALRGGEAKHSLATLANERLRLSFFNSKEAKNIPSPRMVRNDFGKI